MRIAIGASRVHLTRQLTVGALLLAVTGSVELPATWRPARRAARIEPAVALKAQ